MKFILTFLGLTLVFSLSLKAQYWQQRVEYKMHIEMDIDKHRFTGLQEIKYTNNSPDTLKEVFYHLYYNAFQPGSMMDERSHNISDPDPRISNRISKLDSNEIGYHKIISLKQDGTHIHFHEYGTIVKVFLYSPIPPGSSTILEMDFESQIPTQIRRTGRNNIEGIDYSMSQWYPKMAEYDQEGWNAIPYVAREYHGVFGDFDVTIVLDSSYTIAATGILQNPEAIGKGYAARKDINTSEKLTWNFKAENVHDFAWAADPDYIHTIHPVNEDLNLHFFYQNDTAIIRNWERLPEYAAKCFKLMGELVGPYPYSSYSVIQAGDGGMEYPMATLILGNGKLKGLVGVTVHESIHSWFQGVLANNEGKYPWMDEGFNTYYDDLVMNELFGKVEMYAHRRSYASYLKLVERGLYEPLSTHADHFRTNKAYGVAAYSMGCIFLNQLGYVVGQDDLHSSVKRYYREWQFKHPEPRDFKRIVERESGIELDWYFNNFIQTSRQVDYSIISLDKKKKQSIVSLENLGDFPMPVDLSITTKDNRTYHYNIPIRMMYGSKCDDGDLLFIQSEEWKWTENTYQLEIDLPVKEIKSIEIDKYQRTMDIDRSDNIYPLKN